MFGDALATWFIVVGIVLVLALAGAVFAISWAITHRPRKSRCDQPPAAEKP
jgi:hypothetical protein